MKSGFFSFKSVIPSFYTSTAKSVSNIFSTLTMSESEYLHKTEATEKEIVNFLTSKMEMEVILGLKIVLMDLQNGKDVTCFIPRIFEIVATNTSYYAKRLCLAIIDDITLTKRSDVLSYNNKPIRNLSYQRALRHAGKENNEDLNKLDAKLNQIYQYFHQGEKNKSFVFNSPKLINRIRSKRKLEEMCNKIKCF